MQGKLVLTLQDIIMDGQQTRLQIDMHVCGGKLEILPGYKIVDFDIFFVGHGLYKDFD